MVFWKAFVFSLVVLATLYDGAISLRAPSDNETAAAEFMKALDKRYSEECNKDMVARWSYITDVENEDAEQAANEAAVVYFQFQSEAARNVSTYDYENYEDVELYREFRFQADAGPGGLPDEDLNQYQELQSRMETIYNTATICPYNGNSSVNCDLSLDPDLEDIMATSTNWDELKYVWEEWREKSGKLMRQDYIDFVQLSNKAASLDGYSDTGEYWLNWYTVTQKEVDGYSSTGSSLSLIDQNAFKNIVENVYQDVLESLYVPLHAFVRWKLQDLYPDKINLTKPIPAHILGDMWAQDWTNIAKYVMPFEDEPSFDVTESMVENDWDINQIFTSAEDFFISLGLYEMTQDFWDKSVINQTAWGKRIECHASAEDFCLGPGSTDFRIKMCTQINMVDLVTVHHEMGHIEYFMAYRDLPHVFRDSANPGFHEAVGDLIALSVSTPQHMEEILNLTSTRASYRDEKNYTTEEKRELNFLMRMALEKIAFLPFGYLIDKYRWNVFDGTIPSDALNSGWWALRHNIQGVTPPSYDFRGEEYFDPGAKFHVPANVPYIRYFVSFIVQFQFHKRLCEEAGFEGPLYQCDIYDNKAAGDLLKSSLAKGFSQPWPLVLQELGGSLDMDAAPIKEYFEPLMSYLLETIELEGIPVGWDKVNFADLNDEIAQLHLNQMENNLTGYLVTSVEAAWTYNNDVNEDTAEAMNSASEKFSEVYYEWWKNLLSVYDYQSTSEYIKRQFAKQQSIGTAILDPEHLTQLNNALSSMMEAYTHKVCPFDDMKCDEDKEGLDIDTLEKEMATNRKYPELIYYWEKWRDTTGQEMIDDFKDYVGLMNMAAVNNSFTDAGEMWLYPYTTFTSDDYTAADFKMDVAKLWNQTSDYYRRLHAYVLFKLKKHDDYEKYFTDDDLIPAHILGNMWAQSWENIYDLVAPYPDVDLLDISEDLEGRNVREMFEIAEEFFTSMGLPKMTKDFWDNSLLKNPENGSVVICHPSAWDFYSSNLTEQNMAKEGRFRIKMCTDTNQEDFITIHHEMGHTQYQMAYAEGKPIIYRDGANPGFHEAIGDTIALSVSTPSHLQMIADYLNSTKRVREKAPKNDTIEGYRQINFLMKQALAKVAFLPYAYILDLWRWEVFEGNITEDNFNKKWWEKRIIYQGLRPPIDRSPSSDFDVGCKYHVPANVPYIRYFVATILQFQFHERLCKIALPTTLPYECDIYKSTEAGKALLEMLSKGASEHWQDVLAEFLGNGQMSAEALINYFEPLWLYLDKVIEDEGLDLYWKTGDDVIDDYISDVEEISAVVPIVVGVVLAVLVCIVMVAFFVGQKRRKNKEASKLSESADVEKEEKGNVKEEVELQDPKFTEKEKEKEKESPESAVVVDENNDVADQEDKGKINEGLEMDDVPIK